MQNFYEIKSGKTYLQVRVTTRSSKNSVKEIKNGVMQIGVTTIPEDNKANKAIIEIISDVFEVAKSKIEICAGSKSRNKIICIDQEIDLKILEKISLL